MMFKIIPNIPTHNIIYAIISKKEKKSVSFFSISVYMYRINVL